MKTEVNVDIKTELMIAWRSRAKLWTECAKLMAEGAKLRAEGDKLWAEGDKLRAEGDKLWACKILELIGNVTIQWTYIRTVNYDIQYRCKIGNGMIFEPIEEVT